MLNYGTPWRVGTKRHKDRANGLKWPIDIVSETPTKKKRFEPTETPIECSWDLDPELIEYANK